MRDAVFRIYSMTKPITSVGLMRLYRQGRFQLHDPVHRFIPSRKHLQIFVSGTRPVFKTAPVVDAAHTLLVLPAAPRAAGPDLRGADRLNFCLPWLRPVLSFELLISRPTSRA